MSEERPARPRPRSQEPAAAPPAEDVYGLRDRFGGAILEMAAPRGDLTVTVAREALADVCRFLRDAHGFTYPILVSGVDREEHLESVCHLGHPGTGRVVVVKTKLPVDDARVPALTPLFAGMNWHERESFDLMGIEYVGHPDLRRILLFDEWDGHPHPLRKEFKLRPFTASFTVNE